MSTPFSYETVFDASGKTAVLAAYFNDDHLATQDELALLSDRKVVESHEDDAVRTCTWTVRSLRPLPVFVRPFIEGGRLTYVETMKWRKPDDEIDMSIVILGRVKITAVYQLSDLAPGKVRRRYAGSIEVNVPLIAKKIERAIADEIAKGMPVMTECTQNWLRRAGV